MVSQAHVVGRMIDCTYQVQMRHVPDGIPVVSGLTFHVLEQVLPDGSLRLLARIDAILYASRATPILSWQITAPAFEYDMAHVWMAVRASLRRVLEVVTIADLADGTLPASIAELASEYRSETESRHT